LTGFLEAGNDEKVKFIKVPTIRTTTITRVQGRMEVAAGLLHPATTKIILPTCMTGTESMKDRKVVAMAGRTVIVCATTRSYSSRAGA